MEARADPENLRDGKLDKLDELRKMNKMYHEEIARF